LTVQVGSLVIQQIPVSVVKLTQQNFGLIVSSLFSELQENLDYAVSMTHPVNLQKIINIRQ